MSIPKNITNEHIDRVIREINVDQIPKDRLSNKYFLITGDKKLPPKFVLGEANKYANNSILSSDAFNAVEAIAFLKKLNYVIEELETMKNIKLYDIHGATTIENYRTLITSDNKYFYWDSKRFTKNEIGDIVFWVNRTERVVLYTVIDSKEVRPSFNNGRNLINDLDYNVSATAQDKTQFETFYRFKIIEKAQIPEGWNYSNHVPFNGQTMAIILYEPIVNEPEKKIEKINDLIPIFSDNVEVTEILSQAIILLQSFNPSTRKKKVSKLTDQGDFKMQKTITHIESYINSKGFNFKREEIANFYLSLKTKPFVILAGISGTGKTQLPRLFAEAVGMSKEQVIQVPVRPDWTDASDLIGYTALNGQFISKPLTDAILKAKEAPDKPFFFILDEMNLARVEHYFSDFLSIIETRTHKDGKIITDPIITESQIKDAQNKEIFENLHWPENLYLIGTVNMDETTHPFSRKVLDRANSIEMNTVELDWLEKQAETLNPLVDFTNDHLCGKLIGSKDLSDEDKESTKNELEELKEINDILRIADLHFAYRVRDEIIFYATHAKNEDLLKENEALDFQFMQKILPRIHGSSIRTQKVLVGLINRFSGENLSIENPDMSTIQKNKETWIKKSNYPKSLEKLIFMLERFDEDRFTSFWV